MRLFILSFFHFFILSAASAQKISILGDSYSTFEGCVSNDTNEIWYFKPENPLHHKNNDVTKVEETWWHQLISNTKGFSLEVKATSAHSSIVVSS